MHPRHVRANVLRLVDAGLNDCEIARRTGLNRRTVCDMRRYRDRPAAVRETCPRCWLPARRIRFTPEAYSELLGLYLGDGGIAELARTSRLRIVLDDRYPGIITGCQRLLERAFPDNRVQVGQGSTGRCKTVSVYSSHLSCLFPQHGPGRKHERRIRLEAWQAALVQTAPWALLRGCIRSDGCCFVNRTGTYEYLSYQFSNMSEDIARLFFEVCCELALRPRLTRDPRRAIFNVRINRRESVALLVEHVGLKE